MSTIDESVVRRIADLAHLSLSDREVAFYQNHLEKILNYVGQLHQAGVSGEADAPSVASATPERSDEVAASLEPALAVGQAKVVTGTSFRVPRIVE